MFVCVHVHVYAHSPWKCAHNFGNGTHLNFSAKLTLTNFFFCNLKNIFGFFIQIHSGIQWWKFEISFLIFFTPLQPTLMHSTWNLARFFFPFSLFYIFLSFWSLSWLKMKQIWPPYWKATPQTFSLNPSISDRKSLKKHKMDPKMVEISHCSSLVAKIRKFRKKVIKIKSFATSS